MANTCRGVGTGDAEVGLVDGDRTDLCRRRPRSGRRPGPPARPLLVQRLDLGGKRPPEAVATSRPPASVRIVARPLTGAGGIDVATASGGRSGPDVQALYEDWGTVGPSPPSSTAGDAPIDAVPIDEADLLSPVPAPRQVFAIGLNYRAHAEESGMDLPAVPATFTKFPASPRRPLRRRRRCRARRSTGRSSWSS